MDSDVSLVFRGPSAGVPFWIHGCRVLHQHRKDFAVNNSTLIRLERYILCILCFESLFQSNSHLERAVFLETKREKNNPEPILDTCFLKWILVEKQSLTTSCEFKLLYVWMIAFILPWFCWCCCCCACMPMK